MKTNSSQALWYDTDVWKLVVSLSVVSLAVRRHTYLIHPLNAIDYVLLTVLAFSILMTFREWWIERNQPDVWQARQKRKLLKRSLDRLFQMKVGRNLQTLGIVDRRTGRLDDNGKTTAVGITLPARTLKEKVKRWLS